jgi:putative oxidoreductase
MLKKLLATGNHPLQINIGLLILRVFISAAMLTHGYPKLMRIVNGEWRFSDPLGLGVEASLIMACFAEFFCSILLILGLGTRYAAIPLIITMLVAWRIAHGEDPFGTQEKSVMYLITYLTILFAGPGKYSLDHKLFGS